MFCQLIFIFSLKRSFSRLQRFLFFAFFFLFTCQVVGTIECTGFSDLHCPLQDVNLSSFLVFLSLDGSCLFILRWYFTAWINYSSLIHLPPGCSPLLAPMNKVAISHFLSLYISVFLFLFLFLSFLISLWLGISLCLLCMYHMCGHK